jgi:Spx/MgsR family transcriptional regulator
MGNRVTLYGIANCDTIRKARNWLRDHQVEYHFHDYRKDGIDAARLQSMAAQLGWEAMLNRRGTTWRTLPDAQKVDVDEASALHLMEQSPALIKRPILACGDRLYLAFSDRQYREIFDLA